MIPEIILTVVALAFILQFLDASMGMGFGTLTPVLLLMGYEPLEVVPAVIFGSALLSLLAGYMHQDVKNIDYHNKRDLKVASLLVAFGIIGMLLGVYVAVHIPEFYLKLYIGLLVVTIGILLLRDPSKRRSFKWNKITILGTLAAFNKGVAGEGFGPVLAGGQIISGIETKKAVSMTAMTEGIVSTVGIITYYFIGNHEYINPELLFSIAIGGVVATPLAVLFVKYFDTAKLRQSMGFVSIVLGLAVIAQIFA